MSTKPPLTDRELAKLIQFQNQGERIALPVEDGFSLALFEYRNAVQDASHSEHASLNRIWDGIEAQTRLPEENIAPIFSFKKAWIAAAILLIAALSGVFVYLMSDNPVQFASSENIKTIQLADGSTVTLRPNSMLTLVHESSKNVVYSLVGEAFFEIQTSENRSFTVQTSDGEVRVLGTKFNVSTWSGETRVFLLDGSVEVQAKDYQQRLLLAPGQSTAFTSTKLATPANISSDEVIHWMDQTLRFRARELSSILQELNHHFNINATTSPEFARQTLTGTIILSDLEQTLLDLGLVLGGRFVRVSQHSYYFEPAE